MLYRTVGAVLSQEQLDQNGVWRERVIAYASKKLSSAEESYSSFKGELSCLLKMIKKFKYYLGWKKFVVRTGEILKRLVASNILNNLRSYFRSSPATTNEDLPAAFMF